MKTAFLKIGFFVCLVMSAIFAVLLVSNTIIMSSAYASIIYQNRVKIDTILLFVFGIGTIIFKSIEICVELKN